MARVIVVGGEALIDLIVDPDGRLEAAAGGGPYNTARTIGRLGLPVAFVGGLSTDRFGQRLAGELVEDGVDIGLAARTDAPTTLAVADLDPAGAATYRFYTDGTSASALGPDALPEITGRIVTAVHVGTLGLVLTPLADAMEALVAAAPPDAVVMVDPNCRPTATTDPAAYRRRVDRLLGRADVVKVSVEDLAYLRPGAPTVAAADGLLAAGPSVVLVTDGAAAVHVVTARGRTTIVPPRVTVVDTVGAGDAFGGGFLAAWVGSGRGRPELESDDALAVAVRHAVRVASFTCTRAGAEPPTAAELASWTGDG
jgi:fructokinase